MRTSNQRFCVWGVIVLGCASLAIGVSWFKRGMHAAWHQQCNGCCYSLIFALQCYFNDFRTYPPVAVTNSEGALMHSWRAFVLPYIDDDLGKKYNWNEAWNGPNNSRLHDLMPICYRCPLHANDKVAGFYAVSYIATSGVADWVGIDGVGDAGNDCVMLIETDAYRANWLQPLDCVIQEPRLSVIQSLRIQCSSAHPNGSVVGYSDGTFIRGTDLLTIRNWDAESGLAVTTNAGQFKERETGLGPYK